MKNIYRCDNIPHCKDGSDEKGCPLGKDPAVKISYISIIKNCIVWCSNNEQPWHFFTVPKSLTAKKISDENKIKLIIPAFCLSSITIFVMLVLVVGVFIRHRIDHSTRYNVEQDWNAKRTTSQVGVIKLTPKNSSINKILTTKIHS